MTLSASPVQAMEVRVASKGRVLVRDRTMVLVQSGSDLPLRAHSINLINKQYTGASLLRVASGLGLG